MTAGRPEDETPEIDRAVLTVIRDRLQSAPQIETATITTTDEQTKLLVEIAEASTPATVERRFLDIRWYTNGDFRIHYQEDWPADVWQQRWDRHPSTHNDRDHFHPPPDATTPGQDRSWPSEFQEVCKLVIDAIRERTKTIWETDQ